MNMKPLSELTLMDRFLFDSTMEDKATLELVLSIILEQDIHLVDEAQLLLPCACGQLPAAAGRAPGVLRATE